VTGTRDELPPELSDLVRRIREKTDRPIAVGFGVSRAEHVREVCTIADGAIVGSAMVRVIAEAPNEAEAIARASAFARDLAAWKTLAG
jgi:tryptophan synthase alpha chain